MSHNSYTIRKLDLSNHVFTINPDGELLDAKTYESTGQILEKCKNIIEESEKGFDISPDGKIINECDSSECKCVNAMNDSLFSYNTLAIKDHII